MTHLWMNICIPNGGSSGSINSGSLHIVPVETRRIAVGLDLMKDFFELKQFHQFLVGQDKRSCTY